MNTRLALLAPLALVTLATLGTACDSEPSPSSEAWALRDGEVFVPPTTTTGGGLVVKGGHDLPWEVLLQPFLDADLQYQLSFHDDVVTQIRQMFEADFLADERNLADCPWICEDAGLRWNEGAYVGDLVVEYGDVWTEYDRSGAPYWTTDAYGSAEVGCGCE